MVTLLLNWLRFEPMRSVFRTQIALAMLWAWTVSAETSSPSALPLSQPDFQKVPAVAEGATGSQLAQIYCQICHALPRPDLLDKKTWREQTLPRMKIWLGLAPESIERNKDAKWLKASGRFPAQPLLTPEQFERIVDAYLAKAPERALPQAPHAEIVVGLTNLFQFEKPAFKHSPPATTLVQINEAQKRIYVGDEQAKTLDVLDATGKLLSSLNVSNVPVAISDTAQGTYLTMIGSFIPTENPLAALQLLEKTANGFAPGRLILKDLPRTTDTQFADLNGDGKVDFVISIYGNVVGRFSWYENLGDGQYREHVLIPKSGALRSVVRDLNGDGFPDIAVLMAQENETMVILTNDGHGNFTPATVFKQHPLYGHTYFEMADLNGDGRPDFLVTNGDNGEYPSPLKRYHGIRIYLNKGENRFEEAFFFPLNGAFKAVARDFDGDGDLDIAAISFFPDYENEPTESFVYLENRGGLRFKPLTFRECISGRWLTMDAGDLDGDGDVDIVLGSHIYGPTEVPGFLMRDWETIGPSIVILRNKLRAPK